jgi:hypothetical protein
MDPWRRVATLWVGLALALGLAVTGCQAIAYDPCQPLSPVARVRWGPTTACAPEPRACHHLPSRPGSRVPSLQRDAFPLGLAMIPAASPELLYNLTVQFGGMCNHTFQQILVSASLLDAARGGQTSRVAALLATLTSQSQPHQPVPECFSRAQVSQYNARVAIYNARVDRLQVLRMPFPDIIFNMARTQPAVAR